MTHAEREIQILTKVSPVPTQVHARHGFMRALAKWAQRAALRKPKQASANWIFQGALFVLCCMNTAAKTIHELI
jgi:hypothetical protein